MLESKYSLNKRKFLQENQRNFLKNECLLTDLEQDEFENFYNSPIKKLMIAQYSLTSLRYFNNLKEEVQ